MIYCCCFLRFGNIQDGVQDGRNNTMGNHMVFFAMIHCMEKITDSYFS